MLGEGIFDADDVDDACDTLLDELLAVDRGTSGVLRGRLALPVSVDLT